jgi:hypothetical protein
MCNIEIENYGDMFQLTEPLSGQIQNTVAVNSVSAHTMGSRNSRQSGEGTAYEYIKHG